MQPRDRMFRLVGGGIGDNDEHFLKVICSGGGGVMIRAEPRWEILLRLCHAGSWYTDDRKYSPERTLSVCAYDVHATQDRLWTMNFQEILPQCAKVTPSRPL